jgi:hypothetical protein
VDQEIGTAAHLGLRAFTDCCWSGTGGWGLVLKKIGESINFYDG